MGASVRCSHHVPVQSVTSQGPDSGLSLVGGGSGRSLLVRTRDSELQGPCQRVRPQQNPLSGAAKLELEMESRGSQAKAVGQRLLQAYIPQKTGLQAVSSGQRGSVLRWFITVVLNAAFLGMVRAEAAPPQAGERASCRGPALPGRPVLTTCTLCDLCAALLKLLRRQFHLQENGYSSNEM